MSSAHQLQVLFSLPARQASEQVMFACNQKKLQQWLQELPRANTHGYAKQYFLLLHHLNRAELPDAKRFAILESLQEGADHILGSLKTLYSGAPFPLDEKKQAAAVMARQIAIEMLTGYRIIVADKINGKESSILRHDFHLALHRCMEHFGKVLLQCYLIYSQEPEWIWREIHALFLYAEINKLHLGEFTETGSSIEELYKRILLLHLAGPNRLRQSDIEKLYHNLLPWSVVAKISSIINPEAIADNFCINLGTDKAPGFCSDEAEGIEVGDGNIRLLETREMIDHITQTAKVAEGGRIRVDARHRYLMSAPVLRHLLYIWSGRIKRHFSRKPGKHQLEMAIGMTACHHLLIEEDGVELGEQGENELEGISPDLRSLFDIRSKYKTELLPIKHVDVWSNSYTSYADSQDFDIDLASASNSGNWPSKPADTAAPKPAGPAIPLHPITTEDESADGLRLSWSRTEQAQDKLSIRVGEILALHEPDTNRHHPWNICVVRWIRNDNNGRLEIGIRKLSPIGIPAGVRLLHNGKETGDYHRAILLPEIKALHQKESIIFPALMETGKTLRLFINGKTISIHPTTRIASSADFHHFEFEYTNRTRTDKGEADTDFTDEQTRLRQPGEQD